MKSTTLPMAALSEVVMTVDHALFELRGQSTNVRLSKMATGSLHALHRALKMAIQGSLTSLREGRDRFWIDGVHRSTRTRRKLRISLYLTATTGNRFRSERDEEHDRLLLIGSVSQDSML